jgi:hypothetical protein
MLSSDVGVVAVITGITLSFEEIRKAPPEVRRWIEQEIAASLGPQEQPTAARQKTPQIAACSREELAAALSLIQGVFPVVNVFFELGRKGMRFAQDQLEAYRISDIQHHTRLQSSEQVVSCLELINDSLHRVRGSTDTAFYGRDGDYCFVAAETQHNIRRLWFELIGRGELANAAAEPVSGNGPALAQPGTASVPLTAAASAGGASAQE